MKGIEFCQYSSPFLSAPKIRLIVAISATYHPTIGIVDVTNAFQNTLKDSSELYIIDFTPHYLSWFRSRFTNICIKPPPNGSYVIYILRGMQGTKPADQHWNTILNLLLYSLGLFKHVIYQDL